MRQSLIHPVIGERVTVETRQTLLGAEPEEAARVANDFVDDVIRQPVGDCLRLERQAFGSNAKPCRQNHAHQPQGPVKTPDLC